MLQEQELIAVTKGEDIAVIDFKRSRHGLTIICQAHQAIEELFQSWGTGEKQPIRAHGGYWKGLRGNELEVYQLAKLIGVQKSAGGVYYTIDRPGQELYLQDRDYGQVVNLSFLRLVGVSTPSGVAFTVAGVHDTETYDSLCKVIPTAIERFYATYLMPVDVKLRIFTETTL